MFGEVVSPPDDFSELPSLEIYNDLHLSLGLISSASPAGTLLDITATAREGPLQELSLAPAIEGLEELRALGGEIQKSGEELQGSWRVSNWEGSKHLSLRFSLRYLYQGQLVCTEVSIPSF